MNAARVVFPKCLPFILDPLWFSRETTIVTASTLRVLRLFGGHQAGGEVADSEENGGCRRVAERGLDAN